MIDENTLVHNSVANEIAEVTPKVVSILTKLNPDTAFFVAVTSLSYILNYNRSSDNYTEYDLEAAYKILEYLNKLDCELVPYNKNTIH